MQTQQTDLLEIPGWFRRNLGVDSSFLWSSAGITNWLPTDLTVQTEQCLIERTAGNASRVYVWTADKVNTIVQYFAQGADGVITNNASHARQALARLSNFRRVATIQDNPFSHLSPTEDPLSRGVQDRWCNIHPTTLLYYCAKTCLNGSWCWTNVRCGHEWDNHKTAAPICQQEHACHRRADEGSCWVNQNARQTFPSA